LAAPEADARLTAERVERKYLLPFDRVQELATAISGRLQHHRFTGAGANGLPGPRHFVTTIYFDTPARDQFRADHRRHVRVRAKEYYDLHPSLAELASDPRQVVRYQPLLWLELKWKEDDRTGKRRVGLPKRQLPALFGNGVITPEMIALQRDQGEAGLAVLRELASLCERYDEPLRADCLVNYRRLPWQDREGELRVTVDVGLAFYRPPADLWQRQHALVRETLGPPVGHLDAAVVEIKARAALPPWLVQLLDVLGARPAAFSKFEAASGAVHDQVTDRRFPARDQLHVISVR
jgi:hypothetical protein